MKQPPASLAGKRTCYAVDLQAGSPIVICADHVRGRVTFRQVRTKDLEAAEAVGGLLVGCVGARKSFARSVRAPFASRRKAGKVLPTLLDLQLPFALEDCVYEFPVIESGKDSTRALAVGARRADVVAALEAFRHAGIEPAVLDQEGLALWTQSVDEVPPTADRAASMRVVAYLGIGRITIAVGQGERFLAAHGLAGDDAAHIRRLVTAQKEIQDSAVAGDEEATRSGVHWLWTGPGADDPQRLARLRDELIGVWPGSSAVHEEPGLFLARALATRALLAGPIRCNLRSGSLAHPLLVRGAVNRARKAVLFALLSGVLLCAANVAVRAIAVAREKAVDRRLSSLSESLAGHPVRAKGEHALRIVEAAVDDKLSRLAFFVRAFEPSLLHHLAGIVRMGERKGLRYETLSLTADRVLVRGTAPEWRSCEELLTLIREAGYGVKLDRQESLVEERIPFTVGSEGVNE